MPERIAVIIGAGLDVSIIAELVERGIGTDDIHRFMKGQDIVLAGMDIVYEDRKAIYEPIPEPTELERSSRWDNNPRSYRETRRRNKRR